eukprot:scaffold40072_cov25-Tisochrysis_lutea.AAC.3
MGLARPSKSGWRCCLLASGDGSGRNMSGIREPLKKIGKRNRAKRSIVRGVRDGHLKQSERDVKVWARTNG